MSDGESSVELRAARSGGQEARPDLPTLSDRALVSRLLAGDQGAFEWLVEQYHGQLVRLARSFVASDADAQEVAQETWLAVLRGLRGFEGRSALKTWIFRILTNQAKTRGVREGRATPLSALAAPCAGDDQAVDLWRFDADGGWAQPPAPWRHQTPEALLADRQTREALLAAVSALAPNQRTVITLRDVQGWSAAEVCDLLGISETNQRVLLHRARSRVRGALARYLAGEP